MLKATCGCCKERKIEWLHAHQGKNLCDECEAVRATSPVIFDFMLKIVEAQVRACVDEHERSYRHERSDHDY